ncbi:Pseudouridine synthase [Balamuthia mandrillaris]
MEMFEHGGILKKRQKEPIDLLLPKERMKNDGYVYYDTVAAMSTSGCSSSSSSGTTLTLLDFYTHKHGHFPPATWLDRIRKGHVRVEGQVVTDENATLLEGQKLEYHRPAWFEDNVPLLTDEHVLLVDDDFIVVNKPSGLPVLPGGGFLQNTMLHMLRQRFGEGLSPIHRLGRGTSGAILWARNKRAARALGKSMQDHAMKKVYLALAQGTTMEDQFTINRRIGPVEYPLLTFTRTIHAASDDGKPAVSHCTVLKRDEAGDRSLLQVRIETGRPHQIRIHLASHGFPLLGDPLYTKGGVPYSSFTSSPPPSSLGNDDKEAEEREENEEKAGEERGALPGDLGYHLHSWRLSFPHPSNPNHRVKVLCPPPPELDPASFERT